MEDGSLAHDHNDNSFLHFKVTKVTEQDSKNVFLENLKFEVVLTNYTESGEIEREKKLVPKFKDGCFRFDAHISRGREMKIRVAEKSGEGRSFGHWSCSLDNIVKKCTPNEYVSTGCLLTKRKASLFMDIRYIKHGRPKEAGGSVRSVETVNRDEHERGAERHCKPEVVKGHCLVPKVFRSIHQCVNCRGLLWGFTLKGYECSQCGVGLHKHCARRRSLLRCRPVGSRIHDLAKNNSAGRCHNLKPFTPKRFKDFCHVDGHAIRKTANSTPMQCVYCKVKVHADCEKLLPPTCGMNSQESKKLVREQEISYYAIKASEATEDGDDQSIEKLESL